MNKLRPLCSLALLVVNLKLAIEVCSATCHGLCSETQTKSMIATPSILDPSGDSKNNSGTAVIPTKNADAYYHYNEHHDILVDSNNTFDANENSFPKLISFVDFAHNEIIANSSERRTSKNNVIATSGILTAKMHESGATQAYTETHNLRLLSNPIDQNNNSKKIGWTNSLTAVKGMVQEWHENPPVWSGFHIFSRFTSSDDLYVASYRIDGKVTIKKKIRGEYTTLTEKLIEKPVLGQWLKFWFECHGDQLRYFIDEKLMLEAKDDDLNWGTCGVRIDYSNTFIEYIAVKAL
eukprot:Awhi_evm1s5455